MIPRLILLVVAAGAIVALGLNVVPGAFSINAAFDHPLLTFSFTLGAAVLLALVIRYWQVRKLDAGIVSMWRPIVLSLLILVASASLILTNAPRRLVFAGYRTQIARLVPIPDGLIDVRCVVNASIGPYTIDQCARDHRGGEYYRVQRTGETGGHGVRSYGFVFRPNKAGSPFGNRSYKLTQMSDEWFSFEASGEQ